MAEYSILVAEDEHTLRRLLEYRLSKLYKVRTAANGEEALHKIKEEAPDLIISDIMMPKMDGFALQEAIQDDPQTKAIPFIFLTAKADEQSRLKGEDGGADFYITKPFDIEYLLARVNKLLERKAQFQSQLDNRIAEDFQKKLMPTSMPDIDGYRCFFHNKPKEQGGGDLFDWHLTKDGKSLFITIGDVMGKGIQAKFYAFTFLGYVRSTIHSMVLDTRSPAAILNRVNALLHQDNTMGETFASMLLMRFDLEHNRITYANAGHCRPILVTKEGPRIVADSDLILGLDAGADFQDATFEIPPDSALLTYTDGLIEQKLKSGDMVGEQGLMYFASQAFNREQPVKTMLDSVLYHSDEDTFGDDILVFWMQRMGVAPASFPVTDRNPAEFGQPNGNGHSRPVSAAAPSSNWFNLNDD